MPERLLALKLLKLELLLLEPLPQVKAFQPDSVGRLECASARTAALSKPQVECILLLLHVEPAGVPRSIGGACRRLIKARKYD